MDLNGTGGPRECRKLVHEDWLRAVEASINWNRRNAMDRKFADSQTPQSVQATGSGQHATPEQFVDAFNAVFGKQRPGVRANHANGVDLQGEFRPSASASSMSKAPHLQKASVPIAVRFSNFEGNPTVSDTDGLASPRGMSIRFRLPDGSDTDIVAHSYNGFPVATADELREFLLALADQSLRPKGTGALRDDSRGTEGPREGILGLRAEARKGMEVVATS